jgi:hypothetical protein
MAATQVIIETRPDGTGVAVNTQNVPIGLPLGSSVTVYAITRDGAGVFVANVAADAWSLQNKTGGVVDGDLVPAGDAKSAVFTAHIAGTCKIQATSGALAVVQSGKITVVPPTRILQLNSQLLTEFAAISTTSTDPLGPFNTDVQKVTNRVENLEKLTTFPTIEVLWGIGDLTPEDTPMEVWEGKFDIFMYGYFQPDQLDSSDEEGHLFVAGTLLLQDMMRVFAKIITKYINTQGSQWLFMNARTYPPVSYAANKGVVCIACKILAQHQGGDFAT